MKTEGIPSLKNAPKTTTVFDNGPLGLGEILDDAMGSRPEASDRADSIIAECVANDGAFSTVHTDTSGVTFDAAIHESDNGVPRRTGDGLFRRKRGRRSGVSYSGGGGNEFDTLPEGEGMLTRSDAVKHAKASAALLFTFGQGIFGAEWKPLTKAETGGHDERDYLTDRIADYYEARGCVKIPPELGLVLALGSVIVPRLAMPNTQAKLNKVGGGSWKRFKKFLRIKDARNEEENGVEIANP